MGGDAFRLSLPHVAGGLGEERDDFTHSFMNGDHRQSSVRMGRRQGRQYTSPRKMQGKFLNGDDYPVEEQFSVERRVTAVGIYWQRV